nr:amidohydrolase family protein [Lactiplantibacillus garii]
MLFTWTQKNRTNNSTSIKHRLENNIYYEISHAQPWGVDNLEIATKVLGAENVIYGSSYPVKVPWMTEGPAMINDLNVDDNVKTQILMVNADRLYGIHATVN